MALTPRKTPENKFQNLFVSKTILLTSSSVNLGLRLEYERTFSLIHQKDMLHEKTETILSSKKLKNKHFVCLSFLWGQVFLRQREKIFYAYSQPL